MEAKELRISNYVTRNGVICTVEIINGEADEVYILGEDFYYGCQLDEIEPIPLTEEWLLDSGFRTIMVNLYKLSIDNEKSLYVSLNKDGNTHFYISNGFNEIVIRRGKLYVHHLQNVFHNFTGEELTIYN